MEIDLIFVIMKFLHDIATITWIGGLFTMGFIILPSTKKVLPKGGETKKFMKTVQHRLSFLVYISIVVLFLTGLLLARQSGSYLGLISLGNEYSTITTIKHVIYAAMLVITITRSQLLIKFNLKPKKQEKLSVILLFMNIGLGIIVLFLSSLLVGISVPL